MRNENELRKYQDRVATELYENNEKLCVIRPGGGKTVAALTAFRDLKRDGVVRQALVIAPKRVASKVWPDELGAWAHLHGLTYMLLTGGPLERTKRLNTALVPGQTDLIIVGLDNIKWMIERLDTLSIEAPIFDLLIIDEISKLRNPTGVRAKLLSKNARRWKMRWGLSGTLRPNGAQDLFMPVRVITQGGLWGKSFYTWRQERFYPTDFQGYNWAPKPGEEDRLNAEIAPYIVTLKENEYPQLPALSVQLDRVTLPPAARDAYEMMQKKLFATVGGYKSVAAANAAVASGKLAQMANGFVYDLEDGGVGMPEAHGLHDEKREWLEDVIEQADAPTLLIYEYQHDLRMLQELIPDLPYLGAGVSDAKASQHIMKWNRGFYPFMGLHPASGGHGLNLQHGGCDMAWIAPCWSPEYWEQTIARLHRSGQKQPVIVRVCVADRTVDEMKLNRVHYKMTGQEAFEKYMSSIQRA